jgi:hypothetical protein
MRRVLTDYTGVTRMQVVEGHDGGKLVVEGKIGHCDIPTANGRVYPRTIIEREIKRIKPRIEQLSVMSAVDHPGDGKTRIRDAGALVRDLWVESNGEIHGRFEVVEEAPAGQALAAFLRRGAQVGMSSRGMGSTTPGPQGNDVVGEDFKLSTWDFVSDPACQDAYPTAMFEDEGIEVTEDLLRAKYPEIIRAVEERAYVVAQELVETDVRERVEAEAEEAIRQGSDSIREQVKIEVQDEVYQSLKEDFAAQLVRTLAEMRETITEEVKSDLASDPAVAGAKATLKKVAEMVSPFRQAPDMKAVLNEKDVVTEDLRRKVEELEQAEETRRQQIEAIQDKGRHLAYELFIERSLRGRPDAERIREMIGDVSSVQGTEDLQIRVDAALAKAEEVQAEVEAKVQADADEAIKAAEMRAEEKIRKAEAHARQMEEQFKRFQSKANAKLTESAEAEKRLESLVASRVSAFEQKLTAAISERDVLIEEKDEQLTELQDHLAQMEEQMAEMEQQRAADALAAYAYDRTVGHPGARDIAQAVAEGRVTSRAQVDRLASQLEERAHEPGGVHERVRRAMSTGREHLTEDERVEHDASEAMMLEDRGEAADDLREIGTSLHEQLKLAGVRPQRR